MYKTTWRQESFQLLFPMRCFVTLDVTFLERVKRTLSMGGETEEIFLGDAEGILELKNTSIL
jgi:hypothetical protein